MEITEADKETKIKIVITFHKLPGTSISNGMHQECVKFIKPVIHVGLPVLSFPA